MCLIPNTNNCLIAGEDITVYKYASMRLRAKGGRLDGILVHPEDAAMNKNHWVGTELEPVWISPFMSKCPVIYTEGETIVEPMFKGENLCEVNFGLHSYAKLEDAMARADVFRFADGMTAVLECVIPKGTRYWKSIDVPDVDTPDQYCSEALQVKKAVYTQCTETVANSDFVPKKAAPGGSTSV